MKLLPLFVAGALSASSIAAAQPARVAETPFGAVDVKVLNAVVAGGFENILAGLPLYVGALHHPLRDEPMFMAVPMAVALDGRADGPVGSDELQNALPAMRKLIADKTQASLERGSNAVSLQECEKARNDSDRFVVYMNFLKGHPEFLPLVEKFTALREHWDVRIRTLRAARDAADALAKSAADSSDGAPMREQVRPSASIPAAFDRRGALSRIEALSSALSVPEPLEQEDAALLIAKIVGESGGDEAVERAGIRVLADAAAKNAHRTDNLYKWGIAIDLRCIGAIGSESAYPNNKRYAAERLIESVGFSFDRDQEVVLQLKTIGATAADRTSRRQIRRRLRWVSAHSRTSAADAGLALRELESRWAAEKSARAVPNFRRQASAASSWGWSLLKSLLGGE